MGMRLDSQGAGFNGGAIALNIWARVFWQLWQQSRYRIYPGCLKSIDNNPSNADRAKNLLSQKIHKLPLGIV